MADAARARIEAHFHLDAMGDRMEALLEKAIEQRSSNPGQVPSAGFARELGDLSENGDYHAAKEEKGKMEGRIIHLAHVLLDAEIVDATGSGDVVGAGAIVSVAAQKAAADPTGPPREPTLALIALALDKQVALTEPMIRLRLALLTVAQAIDAAAIERALAHAARAYPAQVQEISILPIRALASAGRVNEALDLIRRLAVDHSFDDPQGALVWAALIAQAGTARDVQLMLDDQASSASIISASTSINQLADTASGQLAARLQLEIIF